MPKTKPRVFRDREGFSVPEIQISETGYLNIPARIARIGIQTYYGHELSGVDDVEPDKLYRVYRSEAEVFADESLESFRDLPITFGHPVQGVSAENYRDSAIGHIIGLPVRDGDFIQAELTIRDGDVIKRIKASEGTQLSVGYFADVALESGTTPTGELYDAVQTNIRGNHIALVDNARCGPDCAISIRSSADAACDCVDCQTKNSDTKTKGRNMSELTDMVLLDGSEVPLDEAIETLKEANARIAAALKDAEDTIAKLSGELETKMGEVEAMQKAPTGDSDFAAKVRSRAKMLSQASSVLGDSADLNTVSDSDIRRRVINHIYGDGFAQGASEHALIGMYKVAVRDSHIAADTLNGAVSTSSSNTDLNAALSRRKLRLSSAWKKGA